MNTTAETIDSTKSSPGARYLHDERLFRRRIERIAVLVGEIDFVKQTIPDASQVAKIAEAVATIHSVAMHYDQLHGWGLYAADDIDALEVAP